MMDGNKCILQLRGVRPFLSDKFDITRHKRYRTLSDYNPKNAFDIRKYIDHRLELKPEDMVDLYELDEVVDEDVAEKGEDASTESGST